MSYLIVSPGGPVPAGRLGKYDPSTTVVSRVALPNRDTMSSQEMSERSCTGRRKGRMIYRVL